MGCGVMTRTGAVPGRQTPAAWKATWSYVPIVIGLLALQALAIVLAYRCVAMVAERQYIDAILYFSGALAMMTFLLTIYVTLVRRFIGSPRGVARVETTSGAGGVRLRASRWIFGAASVFAVGAAFFAALFVVLSLAHLLPFEELEGSRRYIYGGLAAFFAVAFATFGVEIICGRFRNMYVELAPDGITYQSPVTLQFAPWSTITDINAGTVPDGTRNTNPQVNVEFSPTKDVVYQKFSWIASLSGAGWWKTISIRPDAYVIGSQALYATLRFYFNYPELRHELASDAGLQRIRNSAR